MSYRKIDVDGVTYEYTVGKQYLKIKGIGTWPRELVGIEVERKRNKYAVTPHIVANIINGLKLFSKVKI
jgi:hypothetical protein